MGVYRHDQTFFQTLPNLMFGGRFLSLQPPQWNATLSDQ